MTKHVAKLTAFIKPSSPTDAVRQAISANTESWLKNTLKIMEEHYLNITMSLSALPYDDVAFPIAVNWAKKRFKARLHHTAVGEAEALLRCASENSDDSYISDSASATTSPRSLVEDSPPGLSLGSRQEPLPAVAVQQVAASAPQAGSPLSPPNSVSLSKSHPTQPSSSFPSPTGRRSPKRTDQKRSQSPPSPSSDGSSVEPNYIHPPQSFQSARTDDGCSTSAASNLHLSSAGCVAGPGNALKPPSEQTLGSKTLQQVAGDKMMRLRHVKHNNANLLVNTTSSDPTTKSISVEPMPQASPASPLTHGELQAVEVGLEKLITHAKLASHPTNRGSGKGYPWTNWHPRGTKINQFSKAPIPQVSRPVHHGWGTNTDDGRGCNIEKQRY
ncbi:uncharacterized protein LOC119024559 [Acanthopagrus latus]|uniref:uncharacterized protein LOC119024559 n=1 Tax=Acanthopagrus latus TaxID=8177 RepID=UPI00187C28E9|nr:uncharacterized protein LOC119024559 [Acanthopagrus latus]